MKKLELLGLGPDGESVTLNDAEGNRYVLPITDDLRVALRRKGASDAQEHPDMTPREIQAKIRGGLSVEDLCELTGQPPARISALAHPIMAEREYAASQALAFPIAHDNGGLTIEELVASRLLSRGVDPADIAWTAYRKQEEPWTLAATFAIANRDHRATWHIDLDRRTLTALDDEATWLSETQIAASGHTWRAANTPPAPAYTTTSNTPQGFEEYETTPEKEENQVDIMLSTLESQRGKARPMPTGEEEIHLEGAHPAASEPENATDATILKLPPRSHLSSVASSDETDRASLPQGDSPRNTDSSSEDQADKNASSSPSLQPALLEVTSENNGRKTEEDKPKKRNPRPSMPSWDEIVFGKKD